MIYTFDGLNFQPISVGHFTHKDGFFDVKARPFASLSVRISGTGEFEIAGEQISSHTGEILFIPAKTPYRVTYSRGESIAIHLIECNYSEAESICLKNAVMIEECFQDLLSQWEDRHSINKAKSAIYDILDKIAEDKKTVIHDTTFSECLTYIQDHFSDPELDVDAICRHGFISQSTLQRHFREHFGVSPKQYLIKLRMDKALALLISGERSVRDIALTCGFGDEKYFSRAFKKKYGHPPHRMQKTSAV